VTTPSAIVLAVLAFGAMILVHEFGHFLLARRVGVRVHAFAIGFGPTIVAWRRGETTYSWNALPLGGYVRMEGEDAEGDGSAASFRAKSVGARMAIIAGGPAMNFLLAIVILALSAATGGVPGGASTRIGTLEAGWPAALAGLQPGDEIVAIDGVPMTSGELVIQTIHRSAGRELVLEVRRGTEVLTARVTPRLDAARGVGRIGFAPEPIHRRLDPARALWWGVERTGQIVGLIVGIIGVLIREGRFLENLGGPLAAGSMLTQAATLGVQTYLQLTAFLSVMIGLFNLFPIPALDGARLAFLALEGIRRRPIDPRREGWVHMVGFALLILLLVFLTVQDVRRLIGAGG
jgi:regulator of sigma E protease